MLDRPAANQCLNITVTVLFLRHDGTDSPADAGDVVAVLNSFHSKIIKVRVSVSGISLHVFEFSFKSLS